MSFAFPAIFIFLLSLPGILFRHGYFVGTWYGPIRFKGLIEELALGLVFSMLLHTIWLWGISMIGFTADYQTVLLLLLGNLSIKEGKAYLEVVQHSVTGFSLYLLSLYTFAFVLGYLLQKIVRFFHLDLAFKLIATHNDWYYLISGEPTYETQGQTPDKAHSGIPLIGGLIQRLRFLKKIKQQRFPDCTYVAVLVESIKSTYIFFGILSSWKLNANGDIDKIVLSGARRRIMGSDVEDKTIEVENDEATPNESLEDRLNNEKFYPIMGNYLIIRGEEMRTLNIQYIWLEPTDESPPSEHRETQSKGLENENRRLKLANRRLACALASAKQLCQRLKLRLQRLKRP